MNEEPSQFVGAFVFVDPRGSEFLDERADQRKRTIGTPIRPTYTRAVAAKCLRCEQPLERLDGAGDIRFWRCLHCTRDYAEKGGQLTDRWLSPISLILYGIIFSRHPQNDAEHIADQFINNANNTRDRLILIVTEIREELAHPKQRVRDILRLQYEETEVSEADVREFLERVADRIALSLAPR